MAIFSLAFSVAQPVSPSADGAIRALQSKVGPSPWPCMSRCPLLPWTPPGRLSSAAEAHCCVSRVLPAPPPLLPSLQPPLAPQRGSALPWLRQFPRGNCQPGQGHLPSCSAQLVCPSQDLSSACTAPLCCLQGWGSSSELGSPESPVHPFLPRNEAHLSTRCTRAGSLQTPPAAQAFQKAKICAPSLSSPI